MLFELINRNMRIKNIRIGLLHNMEHYEFAGHVLTMARGANIKMHEKIPLVGGGGNEARC